MYAKALREQLAPIGVQLQGIVDKAKSENNRGLTTEEREQFHKLEESYSNLEESIKLAEKSASITAKLAGTENPSKILETNLEQVRDEFRLTDKQKRERARAADPHERVFSAFLRDGVTKLSPEDKMFMNKLFVQNAQSTSPGTAGGYTIPQGFSGQLEEAKKWFGGIEGTVGKFSTGTGNPFPWPTLNDTTNRGRIIGQNVQVTETDMTFNQVTFGAYIGSSDIVLIPLALIEDSYFDMDALTARILGTRLGRLYNWKCTVGTGTGEPTGIVTATVAAGNVLILPTGETASITYNDLINLEHAVDPAYRSQGTFMFADAMLKILKKLVDSSNRPLWQPGLTASFREGAGVTENKPMILDHPYVINQDMATPAANAYSALFGDLPSFKVREVAGGTTVLRLQERYADYLQVGYTAFQRFDSNLIDSGTHPVAVLQQSAT